MNFEGPPELPPEETEVAAKQQKTEKPADIPIESVRAEKEAKLQSIRQEVDSWGDRLGEGVDEGIKETVAVYNAMELPTSASCEGHFGSESEHGFPAPWVEVEAPDKPQWRFEHEGEIYEQVAKKYGVTVNAVLHADNDEAWREATQSSAEQKETAEYRAWREENEKLLKKSESLLQEFYRERNVQNDIRIIADRNVGGFRVHNGGKFYIPNNAKERLENELTEEERKRIPDILRASQEEMKSFTDFLKEKYFEGDPSAEHQRKLDSDPTRQFLRDQGFQGDPEVLYSMDVISAKNNKGESLMGSKTFDNFEDLQNFIKNNPDALTQKQKDQMKEGMPIFGTGYNKSVYDWSGSLPPGKSQQMDEAFDSFAAENFDTRKWVSKEKGQEQTTEKPKEKTPQEIKQDIGRTENESLSCLNNPEIYQNVADPKDLEEVIREMGGNARQFEDPEKKILAGMAQKDLEQLNQLLLSGKPEDLISADQVVANYLYRSLSQELKKVFNMTELPISLEDKKKLIYQSLLADKISKRPDILKSRDLISVRKRVGEQIGQYLSKQEQPSAEVSEVETSGQAVKVEPEKDKTTEKTPDAKIKFGVTLNNFVKEFRDGTVPQSFTDFIRSNPSSAQYEAAATKLSRLYGDYLKDKRFPSDKIPEFTDKVRDVAELLNPDRLKFNDALSQLQGDLGNIEGYGNMAQAFESLYGDKAKPTAEQWKNAVGKIHQLMSEYWKDKRLISDKSGEWLEKIKALSKSL